MPPHSLRHPASSHAFDALQAGAVIRVAFGLGAVEGAQHQSAERWEKGQFLPVPPHRARQEQAGGLQGVAAFLA